MITWLAPAALWGLAALAIPILVHLLTRQERQATPFPTLRFLTATRLVSMRHRRLHDWLLLVVRAAIVAAAAAALAGPLLVTSQRQRTWNTRVARAVVVVRLADQHLRLVHEPAKGGRVNDAIAVALIKGAERVRLLRVAPAAAVARVHGVGGQHLFFAVEPVGRGLPERAEATEVAGLVAQPFLIGETEHF